jgi:hypothetical protein
MDTRVFEHFEKHNHIQLEKPSQEQHDSWLEDQKKTLETLRGWSAKNLPTRLISVLASGFPLVIEGLKPSEVDRGQYIGSLRCLLSLAARPRLTFITHAFDWNLASRKARIIAFTDRSIADQYRSKGAYVFDEPAFSLTRVPDDEDALSIAQTAFEAMSGLSASDYIETPGFHQYLQAFDPPSTHNWDNRELFRELASHGERLLIRNRDEAKQYVDYLETDAPQLKSHNERINWVVETWTKCLTQSNFVELARAIQIVAAQEEKLLGIDGKADFPEELSDRLGHLVTNGSVSTSQLVGFVEEVWQAEKTQQGRWADVFTDLLARSVTCQGGEGNLGQIRPLMAQGKLLGTALRRANFYGCVLRRTSTRYSMTLVVQYILETIESLDALAILVPQLKDDKLPWHKSLFGKLVEKSDTVWEILLSWNENKDNLNPPPSILNYVKYALSLEPNLKVSSSFLKGLVKEREAGQVPEQDLIGLLTFFLEGKTLSQLRQRLEWTTDTVDALLELIPAQAIELAEPLLDLPPEFSQTAYDTAATLVVEGQRAGKLPSISGKLQARLKSLREWEQLDKSLTFLSRIGKKVDGEPNPAVSRLIGEALEKVKGLKTSDLIREELQEKVDALEGYLDRDGWWLRWIKVLSQHLETKEYNVLYQKWQDLMLQAKSSEDAITQGTELWLGKRMKDHDDTAAKEFADRLQEWLTALARQGHLQDTQEILLPVIQALVQLQGVHKSSSGATPLSTLAIDCWDLINAFLTDVNPPSRALLPRQRQIEVLTDYIRHEVSTNAISNILGYIEQQGSSDSKLKHWVEDLMIALKASSTDPPKSALARSVGEKFFSKTCYATTSILFLQVARDVIQRHDTKIAEEVKLQVRNFIHKKGSTPFPVFRGIILGTVEDGTGSKPPLTHLVQWWLPRPASVLS